jgi:glycosyltransferase involved in cell wall biosynthesis
MKIMHILPELEEGGVERIVPALANAESRLGHDVRVVSNGGKLESMLAPGVGHIKMPVHRKTPVIGLYCAVKIARLVRSGGISVIHAHSRVPAWICCIVKRLAPGVRFIFTAHASYRRLYYGTWPITRADGITCVSRAVLADLESWLPGKIKKRVIYNPRNGKTQNWIGSGDTKTKHILYVGRISEKKGPIFALEALAQTSNKNWTLDVIGDGPAMRAFRGKMTELGLDDRVYIHGFSNTVSEAIASCDLFLCPSREEGFSLTLMEALSSGTPVLASDIPAARELTSANGENPGGELLPVLDVAAWAKAIDGFLDGKLRPNLKLEIKLPTVDEMASAMIEFYGEIARERA